MAVEAAQTLAHITRSTEVEAVDWEPVDHRLQLPLDPVPTVRLLYRRLERQDHRQLVVVVTNR